MKFVFETLVVGPLAVNCYLVGCPVSGEGLVVDPGDDVGHILSTAERLGLRLTTIVNTHGHFDHVGGNGACKAATGARLLIHPADVPYLARASKAASMYGMSAEDSPQPDGELADGQILSVGQLRITVLHTPGHTPGGCCLVLPDRVITGDTLFADSVGRTDLPGGDQATLLDSIRRQLFTLPGGLQVCPGHGPFTTIGHEQQHNPYL